jgi:hypothetical protein
VVGNLGDFRLVNWEHGRLTTPRDGTRYKYIGRAWGDGNDGRIYPSASLVVAQYCALAETKPFWDSGDWIYAQVRWGLDGALSFLEKDGMLKYMLSAQDHQEHTYDNRFFTGDEKPLVDCFNSRATVNEYDRSNPEVIATSLLIGPAYAVHLYRDRDPDFFTRVEALVVHGYARIKERYQVHPQKYSLGSWIWLNLLVWKMTGEERYRDRAVAEGDRLLELQQTTPVGDQTVSARGWFRRDMTTTANPWGEKPEQEVMITPWIYQGLFKLVEYLPDHPRAPAWREAIAMYARDYLMAIATRNPFGYTPMKADAAPGSTLTRRHGDLSYQYFAAIGRQFHQIGNAAFLMEAGRLLHDQAMIDAAWRQMFWFAGHNPAGYALINGFGNNLNSAQYCTKNLGRVFPGGTINGAVGDQSDQPDFERYNETYTYANLSLLWFATVAGATRFEAPLELWPKEITESPHGADPLHRPRAAFPVRMKGGSTYRFTAVVRDHPDSGLVWQVDGVPGGNDQVGRISADGTYTAPYVTSVIQVVIAAASLADPAIRDQTSVTIMPVPRQVQNLNATVEQGRLALSWDPVPENVTGYTIWKRLPFGTHHAGTIFEMVGATGPEQTTYLYPNDRIRHYQDDLNPIGTSFVVKAHHAHFDPGFVYGADAIGKLSAGWMVVAKPSPERIYGFGPPSNIVTTTVVLSRP